MARDTDVAEIASAMRANLRKAASGRLGCMVIKRRKDIVQGVGRPGMGRYSKRAIGQALRTIHGMKDQLRIDTSYGDYVRATLHPVEAIPCAVCAKDVPLYLFLPCYEERLVALCGSSCRKAFGTLAAMNGWEARGRCALEGRADFYETTYRTSDEILVIHKESMIACNEEYQPFTADRPTEEDLFALRSAMPAVAARMTYLLWREHMYSQCLLPGGLA